MIYLRLLWAIVTFALMGIVKLVLLDLPGLVIVPFVIRRREAIESPVVPGKVIRGIRRDAWCWLWGNDEDGDYCVKAISLHPHWPQFWVMYAWLALRNRTDNLQFTWFCPPPVPGRIGVDYLPWGGFICWQGWRHYVWTPLNRTGRAVSFGWNYYPTDNAPLEPHDPRRFGCGFGWRWTPDGGHLT
jgi:hypothetical protein